MTVLKYTVLALSVLVLALLFVPSRTYQIPSEDELSIRKKLEQNIQEYLESKDSPLASETKFLLAQKHWKLLIAISAIESQYCKRQIAWNCWGVGGDSAYRRYSSLRAAIQDANDLIEYWQQKGRWLTVEDFNGHYVVPYNPTWEKVVNQVLVELNEYE